MIISVITENSRSNRLQYTVDFVLRTLGYDFTFVRLGEKIPEKTLVLSYLDAEKSVQLEKYCSLHVFKSGQLHALDELEKNINLFDWDGLFIPILGRQIISLKKRGLRFKKSGGYFDSKGRSNWYIGFDLFANVFYHLSRYEEKWRHFAEETATDYSTSILSRYQQLKVPVVDVLLEYFDRLIIKRASADGLILLKILNWPAAEEFGIALTHDVDLTRGVSFKERILVKGLGVLRSIAGDREKNKQKNEEMNARDAVIWSYPQLISFYDEQKWKSTFFFLTRMFEGMHIRYNIASKKFRNLLSELKTNGHEIGLHSSLRAFDKRGRYKDEKERLESVISAICVGLRQHYLRAKFPRLWKLAEHAGFSYDSSLSYNYQAGFRAGTSHPFTAYEYDEDKKLSIVEFSLLCFENNLPMDDGAEEIISGLIAQVARFHGIFVALWHPNNFLQEPYLKIWNYMIEKLKAQRIYVDTLSGHLQWYNGRSKLSVSAASHKILIKNPAGLQNFSIQLIGDSKLKEANGADVEVKPDNVLLIKTKNKQITLTLSK